MAAERRFDLVILDYDGTLSNTRLAIAHCLERAFAECGRPIAETARIMPIVQKGLPLRPTCLLVDPTLAWNVGALEELVDAYRRCYRCEGERLIDTFPGAETALRQLRRLGISCVVVSNKGAEAVEHALEQQGLRLFVDAVFADLPGRPQKPDRALLTVCIQPNFPGVARDRMLMVGDTEVDVEFAKNCGIACCWAAYGFGDRRRCLALGPHYVIEDITELPALAGAPIFRDTAAAESRQQYS
jgi:phosphoglycolate phosphatase